MPTPQEMQNWVGTNPQGGSNAANQQRLQQYMNSIGRFGGGLQAGAASGAGSYRDEQGNLIDPGGRFQGGTSAFRAGSPVGGQVGAPNLGMFSSLSNWAQQVPGGQQQLMGMGIAPSYNGMMFGNMGGPNANAEYRSYLNNQAQSGGQPNGPSDQSDYWSYVNRYNLSRGGAPGTQGRQMFEQQSSPGQFSFPSMFGMGQGQQQARPGGMGGGGQFGVGQFSGGMNPLAGRGGAGAGAGAGGGIMGNLQNTINTMMRGGSGVPQNVENAMRTRVGDTVAGQQSSAEQRAREDAVRRGASTSGGGDSDIREQLNRVSAEGSTQQIQGQQGIDQMLSQLGQQNRATGVGAGVNLASAQLRDQQQLRDLMLMMGMLQSQQGPQGGLGSILGGM